MTMGGGTQAVVGSSDPVNLGKNILVHFSTNLCLNFYLPLLICKKYFYYINILFWILNLYVMTVVKKFIVPPLFMTSTL